MPCTIACYRSTDPRAFRPYDLQSYLPQVYFELDADAAQCVLFFDRLAQKAALINSVVGQMHGIPEALHAAASETLVGTCEVRVLPAHSIATLLRGCSLT